MRRYSRFGALAGVVVSPLVALALVVLTLAERRFLETSGWSPVHRTPVEWPSFARARPLWVEPLAGNGDRALETQALGRARVAELGVT